MNSFESIYGCPFGKLLLPKDLIRAWQSNVSRLFLLIANVTSAAEFLTTFFDLEIVSSGQIQSGFTLHLHLSFIKFWEVPLLIISYAQ